ncbi:acyl-CoA thioesterase [Marinibaculum pumilum]|uniref:Acyl-CoA thioesterase n=1 Tax=Marinibaculum pumilum TaxID=1766165 RepID=A0ABV7L907_9PROT
MIAGAMQIHPPAAPLQRAQTGNVYPWHCDQWGHLNVQNYALWFAEAAAHALHRCGLGPSRLAEMSATPFPRRQRVWYRKEFRLGEVAVTDAATTARTGGPTVLARMREAISGAPATDCVMEMALHDAGTLALRDWPEDLSGLAAADSLGDAADLLAPWPVELPAGRLPGMRESLRGVVNTWDCDQHGTATTKRYFNAFSDAGLALMTGLQLDPKVLLEAGLSSAALEYRVIYDRRMRAGDAFVMFTGMTAAEGRKTWRFVHVMEDAATGAPIARTDVVGVFIDAKARRAVPPPDWVRSRTDGIRID